MTQEKQVALAREAVDHAQDGFNKLAVLAVAALRADDPDHRWQLLLVMLDVISMYSEIFDDMKPRAHC